MRYQRRTIASIGEDVKKLEPSYVIVGNVKCAAWQVLKNLNIKLQYEQKSY